MGCDNEIIGVKKLALYINKDVRFRRPDPSNEDEIDLIAHAIGSYVISDINEYPKWERIVGYSENYKQNYIDEFTFFIHGVENQTPQIIKDLRNNRIGYIAEIVTKGNQSYVFQSPIFLNKKNTKQVDSNSWTVSLSYRVPTFLDRLNKLNTLLMDASYILIDGGSIWGAGNNTAIISG